MHIGIVRICRLGLAWFAACVAAWAAWPACAADDINSQAPIGWSMQPGQSLADIKATLKERPLRIVDIDHDGGDRFTVTYVRNEGNYARRWWWYVGIDEATVKAHLNEHHARLTALKAYDAGGGKEHFAVAMVANEGPDAKSWWWLHDKTVDEVRALANAHDARLTALQSYQLGTRTRYAGILVDNTGSERKAWWWVPGESPDAIRAKAREHEARIVSLTPAGGGRFNAVMVSCEGGCPTWWWFHELDAQGVIDRAFDHGARPSNVASYHCGGGLCYAGTLLSNVPDDVVSCDASGCISQAQLARNICDTLKKTVVGYACLVGQVRPAYGGLARKAVDTELDMAPHVPINVASVSKTITAVAVMKMLTDKGLNVDNRISPYIYADWTQGPNVSTLSFRDLLTHSTGFSQADAGACGNNVNYAGLKAIVAAGVDSKQTRVRQYGNCNFALVRELMLVLSGATPKSNETQRAQQSADAYVDYVRRHVLQPVGVSSGRQCKPPAGEPVAMSYAGTSGNAAGNDWGDWTLLCGGGGWVLSATDLHRVFHDIAVGDRVLASWQRQQLFLGQLGWDSALRSDCPNPGVCKNGGLGPTTNGLLLSTYAGIHKCNVSVVVVANSPLPPPYPTQGDIIGLVADALKGAAVPGTARSCP